MAEVVYSRPLIDKLGVKPGARVALINIDDAEFRRLLAERTHDITEGEALAESDLVFVGIDEAGELDKLAPLRGQIVANGAIWVVSRKGKSATLLDVEVIEAAEAFGLVDNKVVSFSTSHTSLRLVIPIALR